MDMVEKVAKAIFMAERLGATDEDWAMHNPTEYWRKARAAIEAMREPTQAMLCAMYGKASRHDADVVALNDRINAIQWQDGIDAALKWPSAGMGNGR